MNRWPMNRAAEHESGTVAYPPASSFQDWNAQELGSSSTSISLPRVPRIVFFAHLRGISATKMPGPVSRRLSAVDQAEGGPGGGTQRRIHHGSIAEKEEGPNPEALHGDRTCCSSVVRRRTAVLYVRFQKDSLRKEPKPNLRKGHTNPQDGRPNGCVWKWGEPPKTLGSKIQYSTHWG